MKKSIDANGRTVYGSSHSIAKGGSVYVHKALQRIGDKQGLRNALEAISKKYNLIDSTIKIYDNIFFLFFHLPKSLAPATLIESIGKNISLFGVWDKEYVFMHVYDLQEQFIREDVDKWGYDYDKG